MSGTAPRRTQQQRRDATRGRLLDAAVGCLAERGYAGTSTAAVCDRAGLSQGALFRHYPTRQALLVATAEHVSDVLVRRFLAELGELTYDPSRFREVVGLLRDLSMSEENRTWHELVTASRTDADLRTALRPALDRFHRSILDAARSYFDGRLAEQELIVLISLVINLLDGLVFSRAVSQRDVVGDKVLDLLASLLVERLPDS